LDKEHSLADLPKIQAFEALKTAKTAEEKIAAINEGRLPHEVVTPFADSDAVWAALVKQMPIFAMLKNLATIERHKAAEANRKYIEDLFSNPDVIAKSKILPYRFVEAEKHVTSSWMKDALRDGLELSFVNIPEIPGKTAVFLDVSGSMGPGYHSHEPDIMSKAAIFGVALMKKVDDGKFLLYDTQYADRSSGGWGSRQVARIREFPVSKRDSILTQASKIIAEGGTDTGAPFQKILDANERYDQVILITDEQQNAGAPAYKVWNEYLDKVNPNAKLFVVDVNSYRNAAFDPKQKNVYYIFGWSDKALDFISLASQGWDNIADYIEQS
jgi:60 kDa SS-A/Ro ribonucleoprotein